MRIDLDHALLKVSEKALAHRRNNCGEKKLDEHKLMIYIEENQPSTLKCFTLYFLSRPSCHVDGNFSVNKAKELR